MKTKKSGAAPKRKRKPHNAHTAEYGSFQELLAQISAEPRTALVGDKEVSMSRSDRLLRLMLNRALQGNVRDITKLLQMMAKSPSLVATFREETVIVISGPLENV